MQVGDLVCNADLKIAIKNWYRRWKMSELRERESETSHIKLKMPRDDLIKAMEDIIFAYNTKQQQNPTIRRCFDKTGFNLGKGFKDDLKEYTEWVDSLSSEAIYKSLIGANGAADLADLRQSPVAHWYRRKHSYLTARAREFRMFLSLGVIV